MTAQSRAEGSHSWQQEDIWVPWTRPGTVLGRTSHTGLRLWAWVGAGQDLLEFQNMEK